MGKKLPGVTLVLGGARSGKSSFAENLVEESGLKPVYVATAQAFDSEMKDRIERHRARRGDQWETVEAPIELPEMLKLQSTGEKAILVDCLTLWLSNLMIKEMDIEAEVTRLIEVLSKPTAPVVLVSNEVGMSIVPENKMAREFRDHAGVLNQEIAGVASQVFLVAAGLPMKLK
ncbi:MAG: bifunctional adenosylcobinamide kinase/adenosylcobinamide-phosphate guanylyltransferase [Pseudomonadota bacterium]